MDGNGLVFLVRTVHTVGNYIEKTINNKHHIDRVWARNLQVKISIPIIVDEYNHLMDGVDIVDQHIAYYYPNIRCRRN